ncbi:ribonuclease H-like domain-containing protein [Haloplanus halobius]|uniref:ribonuclease H-like domain-containing protein n=1 Tax=Haloplanus halobius TaxID=2934938 RepID=UPI00200C9A54|nr:ribonuclease H-like domain-containing protein [Haloplanus sp. XH21]
MRYPRDDPGYARLATLDIETTAADPAEGELVSIGVGHHDRSDPLSKATYESFHRRGDDEVALVRDAVAWLDDAGADALVSYNGVGFDLDFIDARLDRHGVDISRPAVADADTHLDLFRDRRRRAERDGDPWPALEDCLRAYGLTPATTVWQGAPVDNTRFGEELGPAYLRTLDTATGARLRDALVEAIDHYLRTDLEANFALFYADIGDSPDPSYLGTRAQFDV